MKNIKRKTEALVIPFQDIPFEGMDVETEVQFSDLGEASSEAESNFPKAIHVMAHLVPVGSKLDLKGTFSTLRYGVCDRCMIEVVQSVDGQLDRFLMPKKQFSQHDKPGGKVIHGPSRGAKPSRHHSQSKAVELSDAEGEHEDLSFGAFDGETVDLRPILREQLILLMPMRTLCSEACQGLCVNCGENINESRCLCPEGPLRVQIEEERKNSKLTTGLGEIIKEKVS